MFRSQFLILLGGCLLAASAAWADDVAYIECSSHPDGTQVFAKPRKSPEVVASVACGERFTVLVYGFVFSRVQTSEGKIGYVYSNVIAVDRAAAPVQKPASPQIVTASEKVPVRTTPVAQPTPPPPAKPQPAPAQSAVAAAPASAAPEPVSAASAAGTPNLPEITVPATPPARAAAPASGSLLPTPSVPETTVTPAPPQPAATPESAPAPVSSAPATPAASSTVPESTPPAAQPDPSAPAQPPPAAPAVRPAETSGTWERPLPSGRTTTPRVEAFGGYSFARLDGGAGSSTNLNGAMGSFGWNVKPWLQIVADSSYNVVTISGTKNVLYGNHFGPRYFHRSRNHWGATPFVEALVGGSRADTTVTGTGGYTTSTNCISYKVGGGVDLHPSRHWEVRLFDVDYYRTSFGTNVHQNNYWASVGVVLRFFGGSSDY